MDFGVIYETQNLVIGPGDTGKVTSSVEGHLFDPVRVSPGVASSRVINLAKQKFVSRARQAISPFQGGVFLGELKEAIHLVRHPASALFHGVTHGYPSAVTKRLRGLKKYRDFHSTRSLRQASKIISETWLEYSFGWRPLISDVQSGAEALARFVTQSDTIQIVTAHAKSRDSDGSGFQNTRVQAGFSNLTYSYNVQQWTETECWMYGGADISSGLNTESASRLAGLQWADVIPTVWELIPYSFLVDYFSNVGDVISGATFCTSRLTYWGLSTMVRRGVILDGYRFVPNFAGDVGGSDKGKSAVYINSFSREATPSLVPSLQFECPGVESLKWLNIASLVGVKTQGAALKRELQAFRN